ncbi:MAG: TonB family protein [Betaproteobacteria bacterium]|nr:TonB family protein [Betaproteobacteria bacterium]
MVAVSLGLHGALLWGIGEPDKRSGNLLPALQATLRIPAISAAQTLPAPVVPETVAPTPRALRAGQSSSKRLALPPSPGGVASTTVAPSDVQDFPVTHQAVPTETVAAALPPPVVQPAIDVDRLLNGYGRRVSELLAREHAYPRVAQMRGWEGEVRLRLRVARKGALLAVSVERSSGFEVLDQHALALVEQLRGLPPLPEEIGAGEVQVVVPVSYRLKGPT